MIGRVASMERGRMARYAGVSVGGVLLTQLLLVLCHAVAGMGPATSNTVGVLGASIPVFFANRTWVWGVTDAGSIPRELAPFWAFTFAGLVLSTFAVGTVAAATDSTLAVSVANIAAFGVLWLAKYFVLDEIVFGSSEGEDLLVA